VKVHSNNNVISDNNTPPVSSLNQNLLESNSTSSGTGSDSPLSDVTSSNTDRSVAVVESEREGVDTEESICKQALGAVALERIECESSVDSSCTSKIDDLRKDHNSNRENKTNHSDDARDDNSEDNAIQKPPPPESNTERGCKDSQSTSENNEGKSTKSATTTQPLSNATTKRKKLQNFQQPKREKQSRDDSGGVCGQMLTPVNLLISASFLVLSIGMGYWFL
jgi:hypothetical protein